MNQDASIGSAVTRRAFWQNYSLAIGTILMFALTWPFYSSLGFFVGYGLATAALVMTGLTEGGAGVRALLRRYLIWRVGLRWYLVVLLGPAFVGLAAMALVYAWSGQVPDWSNGEASRILGTSTNLWLFVVLFFLVDALTNGEEMAWRGFVLPKLQARFSALVASLILGAVWGLWHLPRFWLAGDAGSFALAMVHNLAMAVVFTWVYNNTSGSLLIATLFHAATNTAYLFLVGGPSVTGDATLRLVSIGIEVVAACVIVVAAGPARLSRRPPVQAGV